MGCGAAVVTVGPAQAHSGAVAAGLAGRVAEIPRLAYAGCSAAWRGLARLAVVACTVARSELAFGTGVAHVRNHILANQQLLKCARGAF